MASTPQWSGAKNGLPGDQNALNEAAQVTQTLGTHTFRVIYPGTQILGSFSPNSDFQWVPLRDDVNVDQPFVMSGTSIGRVTVPVLPNGAGADMLVSLYANSAGNPNVTTLLAATLVPKEWITTQAAPNGIENGGPLANAMFNGCQLSGGISSNPYTASGSSGTLDVYSVTKVYNGTYIMQLGGSTIPPGTGPSTPTQTNVTSSVEYVGDGQVGRVASTTALIDARDQVAAGVTNDTIMVAGGDTYISGATTSHAETYTASWDPNTGVIGAWAQQGDLPVDVDGAMGVGHPDFDVLYVLGGNRAGAANGSTICVYGTVTNGQVSQWFKMASLPVPIYYGYAAVVGDWLFVAAGKSAIDFSFLNATYYMHLTNGIPDGAWISGPAVPQPLGMANVFSNQWGACNTANAFGVVQGASETGSLGIYVNTTAFLMVDDVTGPADNWLSMSWGDPNNQFTDPGQIATFSNDDGSYEVMNLHPGAGTAEHCSLVPVPQVSVPLYVTGLTNAATYHLVIKQAPGPTADDFLSFGITSGNLPNDMLVSSANANTWSSYSAGFSMPLAVYSNTTTADTHPLHTWEDPTATGSTYTSNIATRVSTMVHSYEGKLVGLIESTMMPNLALNANPTFTSGVSSWTAHLCSLTQSSAQTHGGFSFSGLMTPTGGNPTVYVESNLAFLGNDTPTLGQRWLAPNGWFYSPTGTTSFSLSVNWYNVSQTYISTSSKTVTLTAATWTNVTNTFAVPKSAVYATIVPTESGSPTTSNTIYLSNVSLLLSPESVNSVATAVTVDYDPDTTFPISVTELT